MADQSWGKGNCVYCINFLILFICPLFALGGYVEFEKEDVSILQRCAVREERGGGGEGGRGVAATQRFQSKLFVRREGKKKTSTNTPT
jgi:hypothetical protein